MTPDRLPLPDAALISEIESLAVELAQLGGSEIRAALGGMLRIKYKGAEDDATQVKDPVSDIDDRVETMIRARLGECFPAHDIIGEEIDHRPSLGHEFLWAVDPIDGTANFINGFPLFASSVGVLYRGQPLAGAVWCSTSHTLESGVYHAASGGPLRFNGVPVATAPNPGIRRRLGGEPFASRGAPHGWDGRKTGSAAIECAFVAAGILEIAWFERPNIWDVAGGLALVHAAQGDVLEHNADGWQPFPGFSDGSADPGRWTAPIAIGEASTLARFAERSPI
ncbi:inositol monophosphatase [Blastomonas sp.]|uniref:inositol monophosphatase family protein n=1 Tax=Blastomonas sp. TaxID=1909299 RepID=UPI00260B789B|nr:inositol monophosphatase [Blastomonas sp.]MDM7957464.1 inositol monophosphatase [Blastomonas sp.]